jgi:molybdopterin-guanine dinucleotide biosynthesis protein A
MNTKFITGIVLAGGQSSRMGTDKSLMKLKGKTLVEYAVDALKPLCNKVIISSDKMVYGFTGCDVWPDEIPNLAPMVGIYSCLNRSETEINIISSCDMPMISSELIEYLLSNSEGHEITVPVHLDNLIEPLCGIYKKTSVNMMKEFVDNGNFRLHEFIRFADGNLVPIGPELPFYSATLFSNINRRADFDRLLLG